ncbi:MAG TPA: hypothetical protein VGI60_17865 [Chthoniobacterales bacterium]|jgi:hypothetical protein
MALLPLRAVEVRQAAGAAHAYPEMRDLQGKEMAKGEFTQDIDGSLLRIKISYDLKSGGRIEEKATFSSHPELRQRTWSWREWGDHSLKREYLVDFDSGQASARKQTKDGKKEWSKRLEIESGRTFAGFGFALVLQNLRDQLVKGQAVELKAVGFTPGPRIVTVKLTYEGVDKMRMSGRTLRGEHFMVQPQIPAIAKLFIRVPDTHIWLTPLPSGFLRWEGALAEPSDELARVDVSSGERSGAAAKVED